MQGGCRRLGMPESGDDESGGIHGNIIVKFAGDEGVDPDYPEQRGHLEKQKLDP